MERDEQMAIETAAQQRSLAHSELDPATGCRTSAFLSRSGASGLYRRMSVCGRKIPVHRLALAQHLSLTLEEMAALKDDTGTPLTVDHSCYNPGCIEPAHLSLAPLAVNVSRARRLRGNGCDHAVTGTNVAMNKGVGRCRACSLARHRVTGARRQGRDLSHSDALAAVFALHPAMFADAHRRLDAVGA